MQRVTAYTAPGLTWCASRDFDKNWTKIGTSVERVRSARPLLVGRGAVCARLRAVLAGLDGMLFLEFDVRRLGSRIDAVLVSGPAVFPIEFKCGEQGFTTDAYNQAWDYGLDLKNFHEASDAAPSFPILVATGATV